MRGSTAAESIHQSDDDKRPSSSRRLPTHLPLTHSLTHSLTPASNDIDTTYLIPPPSHRPRPDLPDCQHAPSY